MLQCLSNFSLSNQAIFKPFGNYVKIIKVEGQRVRVQGVMKAHDCTLNHLAPIRFNDNMPTLLGFTNVENSYIKWIAYQDRIDLHFEGEGSYLSGGTTKRNTMYAICMKAKMLIMH